MTRKCSPDQTVRVLGERLRRFERRFRPRGAGSVSTGSRDLDQLLPQQGFLRGSLVEWLAEGDGTGVVWVALAGAREACGQSRALVVVDRRREFHPPAAGVDLDRLVLVRPANRRDELWAIDQALRCAGVGAVLAWPGRLDGRISRQWQLAAEAGGTLGFLIRPLAARSEPSWAAVRLAVEPLPRTQGLGQPACSSPGEGRRVRIQLLRCPGGREGTRLEIEIDDQTGALRLAPPLVQPIRRAVPAFSGGLDRPG